MADLQALANAVIKGNQADSVRLTQEALAEKAWASCAEALERGDHRRRGADLGDERVDVSCV